MILNDLKCEVCGDHLVHEGEETIKAFEEAIDLNYKSFLNGVDKIVGQFLVYRCQGCHGLFRYTYKEAERLMRKSATELVLFKMAREFVYEDPHAKYFIYCGKCSGFDGKGSCPKSVYEKCPIKEFPIDVI
jgi:ribosomal protein S27E